MATSFFYIYIDIYIDIDIDIYIYIYITFKNWRSVQSFYWTPFLFQVGFGFPLAPSLTMSIIFPTMPEVSKSFTKDS